jgi:hypothetical protein
LDWNDGPGPESDSARKQPDAEWRSGQRSRGVGDPAQECLNGGQFDLYYVKGDVTMRLAMDPHRRFGVRSVYKAESGSPILIEPVGHEFYPVFFLHFHVHAVRFCDVRGA